jgi:hypothetical protein
VAAKTKVKPKGKVKPVAKQKTKVKAKPKGLVYSAAQWKAYNKAYTAKANQLALAAATNRFRKYRLQAAYSTIKAANVATHNAQTAAIAAFATKQSWNQAKLAHQNKALDARIELDAYNHANMAGRLQYVQGGVKAYALRAISRTVDTAQARSYEEAVFAKARRQAKKAKKTTKSTKRSAQSKAIAAAAAKAGAAARGKGVTQASINAKASKTAKATAHATVLRKRAARVAAAKQSHNKSAQSKKAPVTKAKARTAPYLGIMRSVTFDGNGYWHHGNNEFAGTCIMTAVANALHHQTKWRLPDEDIAYWTGRLGRKPTIEKALLMLWTQQPWPQVKLLQPIPLVACYEYFCERVIGFENEHGDHAAFAFGAKMVSYGELVPVAENIEECWTCEFVERDT